MPQHQIILNMSGTGVVVSSVSLTALTRSDTGAPPAGLPTLPQPFVFANGQWTYTFSDPAANPPVYNFGFIVTYATGASLAYSSTLHALALITNGIIQVSKGGVYKGVLGNAIDLGQPPNLAWPPDLSVLSSFTLTLTRSDYNPRAGVPTLTITGSPLIATGTGKAVRFEMISSQSSQLAIGSGFEAYRFKATAMSGSDTVVLQEGVMPVAP